jgi:hypothetical protein
MIIMATIIKVDGSEEKLGTTTLESFQEAVGGYIESIRLDDGRVMLVNEEGLVEGLPVNHRAMDFLSRYGKLTQPIVGNVVICEKRGFK